MILGHFINIPISIFVTMKMLPLLFIAAIIEICFIFLVLIFPYVKNSGESIAYLKENLNLQPP